MVSVLKGLNLAVRFGLEVALLAALGASCWRAVPEGPGRVVATVGVVVTVMVVWATVVHGASIPVAARVATQVVLFALAVAAVAASGRPGLAAALAALVALNAALMAAWGQ